MVNLTIDGKQVTVSKTATIYQAAEQAGIKIPILCYAKKLFPYGACRVCLVEVEQMKGRLIPSCTTPVTEGMIVTTMSPEILKVRKTVLEFLLVNHVLDCPVCDKGGECDLQDLTYEYEVRTNRFEGEKFDLPTDEINPLIERNMNRCVLCGKCARVCDEVRQRKKRVSGLQRPALKFHSSCSSLSLRIALSSLSTQCQALKQPITRPATSNARVQERSPG